MTHPTPHVPRTGVLLLALLLTLPLSGCAAGHHDGPAGTDGTVVMESHHTPNHGVNGQISQS